MPKQRHRASKTTVAHKISSNRMKFKIGTRETGKPAHFMSNDELFQLLNDDKKKKHFSKILKVLRLRNVQVPII